jgi:tetratricopeptide (TPR) repeat protein
VPSSGELTDGVSCIDSGGESGQREQLDEIVAAHLVDEHAPDRYSMHDLLRRYATELAGQEDGEPDRRSALARLYDHYLYGAAAAADLLYPFTVRLPLPSAATEGTTFGDDVQAREWLDAERANLVAAVQHAAEHGARQPAWRLGDALRGHLSMRMHTVEWASIAQASLAAAESDGDPFGRATAHISLAMLHSVQSRYQEAVDSYVRAADLSRRAGWPEGEGVAVGNVYLSLGRFAEAANHYERALAIHHRTGFLLGQAAMLGNLGQVHGYLGHLELAAAELAQALLLHRRTGTRVAASRNLANLGWVYHRLGRTEHALTHLTEALAVHRELGDRSTEGDTARQLAEVHRDTGNHTWALDLAGTALTIAREAGPDRYDECLALITEADVHHHVGDIRQAIDGYRHARTLARDLGNTYLQAEALTGLAAASLAAGRPDVAIEHAHTAHTLAGDAGYRLIEGNALITLAAIALTQDRARDAQNLAEQGLTVHTTAGHPPGKARAHLLLGYALRATGDNHTGLSHHTRAHTLFSEIGATLPDQTRILLGATTIALT